MTSNTKFIVVGIDGSDASLTALRWAIREGAATGARVDVVHAWHAQNTRDIAFGSPHELATGSACMLQNEVAAAMVGLPVVPEVTESSVHGRPASVLVDKARGARMLVLGAHGRTGLMDVVFGQVAATSRKHADCQVVIVHADGLVEPADIEQSMPADH